MRPPLQSVSCGSSREKRTNHVVTGGCKQRDAVLMMLMCYENEDMAVVVVYHDVDQFYDGDNDEDWCSFCLLLLIVACSYVWRQFSMSSESAQDVVEHHQRRHYHRQQPLETTALQTGWQAEVIPIQEWIFPSCYYYYCCTCYP